MITYTFVTLVIQESLENYFRGRLYKQACKRNVLSNKYNSKFSFCTIHFFYIHHEKKYLLRLRGVTELHVETIKFHKI